MLAVKAPISPRWVPAWTHSLGMKAVLAVVAAATMSVLASACCRSSVARAVMPARARVATTLCALSNWRPQIVISDRLNTLWCAMAMCADSAPLPTTSSRVLMGRARRRAASAAAAEVRRKVSSVPSITASGVPSLHEVTT